MATATYPRRQAGTFAAGSQRQPKCDPRFLYLRHRMSGPARGRASYVGEVARGILDPGTVAVALLFGSAIVTNGGQPPDTTWLTHGADDLWASDVDMG